MTQAGEVSSVPAQGHVWRYEIQHGPDGETDYAWVYDDKNNMVCTAKTHHAMAIVAAHSGVALDATDVHYLGAIKLRLERLYEENPNDCRLREHISDEVSWIDGLTDALTVPPVAP